MRPRVAVGVAGRQHRQPAAPLRHESPAVSHRPSRRHLLYRQHPRLPGEDRLQVVHLGDRPDAVQRQADPHPVQEGAGHPQPGAGGDVARRFGLPDGLQKAVQLQVAEAGVVLGGGEVAEDGLGRRGAGGEKVGRLPPGDAQTGHAGVDLDFVGDVGAGQPPVVDGGGEAVLAELVLFALQTAAQHQDAPAVHPATQFPGLGQGGDREVLHPLLHQHGRHQPHSVAVSVGLDHRDDAGGGGQAGADGPQVLRQPRAGDFGPGSSHSDS